jgi:hypothetical protein
MFFKIKYIVWFFQVLFHSFKTLVFNPIIYFKEKIWLEDFYDFLTAIDLDNDEEFTKIIDETLKKE